MRCVPFAWMVLALGPAAAQTPPRCDTPQYRQLDFWVGDWAVSVRGKPAGTNQVTREESGCLVHEHWTGAAGGTGQSFNFYDRTDGRWHQVWVSSSGNTLFLSGQYAGDRLVYGGVAPGPTGAPVQQRLTFFHNADGTVRQLWESSADGKQWQTVFDGLYVRKSR
ncbi:MAG TPA: hypothetical protein VIW26_01525 [Gemmatimonadales bacterium]